MMRSKKKSRRSCRGDKKDGNLREFSLLLHDRRLKLAIVTRDATSGVASGLPGLLLLANHVVDLVLLCRLLFELVFEIGRRHVACCLLLVGFCWNVLMSFGLAIQSLPNNYNHEDVENPVTDIFERWTWCSSNQLVVGINATKVPKFPRHQSTDFIYCGIGILCLLFLGSAVAVFFSLLFLAARPPAAAIRFKPSRRVTTFKYRLPLKLCHENKTNKCQTPKQPPLQQNERLMSQDEVQSNQNSPKLQRQTCCHHEKYKIVSCTGAINGITEEDEVQVFHLKCEACSKVLLELETQMDLFVVRCC